MVKHVVMWKLKDEAEGNRLETNRKLVKDMLENLVPIIPEIDSLEVGFNFNPSDAAFDMVLITTHQNEDALKSYVAHAAHQQVATFIGKIVGERKVVDYEY